MFDDPEVEEYARRLKNCGFRVFRLKDRPEVGWFIFERQGKLGYAQRDEYRGWSFSTKHKPNHSTGTGFMMSQGVVRPGLPHADECFHFAPAWATEEQRRSVVKYSSIEEYLNREQVLQYQEV